MKCELCIQDFSVLTPTNFKDMVWKQGKKYEEIKENDVVERFEIELCYDCRQKIFGRSRIIITFNQELLETLILCDKEIDIKTEEKQKCLN